MILILIHEHLLGPAYLAVLPPAFNSPMFWGPADLAELQASSILSKIGKTSADEMILSKIIPVIRAHPDAFAHSQTLSDADLLDLAHRMGSAIMAYAFDLDPEDAPPSEDEDEDETDGNNDGWAEDKDPIRHMGMVPMADILNSDAHDFNAHINHGPDFLTATSIRPIAAGEEILNYYGPMSNAELLRRYGYVTPKHARNDVVELPWGLVLARLRARFSVSMKQSDWERVTALLDPEELEEELEDSFVLERAVADPDDDGRVPQPDCPRFDALPEELEHQVKVFLKAVRQASSNGDVVEALADKNVRKEIYLDAVLSALKDREAQYATTLEQDDELARAIDGGPRTRRDMALWVRRGEKALLREAQGWVLHKLGEVRRVEGDGRREADGPGAKRQRR